MFLPLTCSLHFLRLKRGCFGVCGRAFSMRGYRGITKPKYRGVCRGWLAQNKAAGLWKIGFKTQAAARDWLAAALGVQPSSLLKTLPRESGRRGVASKQPTIGESVTSSFAWRMLLGPPLE